MEYQKANAPAPSASTTADVPQQLTNKETGGKVSANLENNVDDSTMEISPSSTSGGTPSLADYSIEEMEVGRIDNAPSTSDILHDMEDANLDSVKTESHRPYPLDFPLHNMKESKKGSGPSDIQDKFEHERKASPVIGDLPKKNRLDSNFSQLVDGFLNILSYAKLPEQTLESARLETSSSRLDEPQEVEGGIAEIAPDGSNQVCAIVGSSQEFVEQVPLVRSPSPMDLHGEVELCDAATEILSDGHGSVANLQELEHMDETDPPLITDLPEHIFNRYIFEYLPFNDVYKLREVNQKLKERVEEYLHSDCERMSNHPFDVYFVPEKDIMTLPGDDIEIIAGVQSLQYLLNMDFRLPKTNFNIKFCRTLELYEIFECSRNGMIWEFVRLYGSQIRTLSITRMGFHLSRKENEFYESLPNLRELTVREIDTRIIYPEGLDNSILENWELPNIFRNLNSVNFLRVEVANAEQDIFGEKVRLIRQKIIALGVQNVLVMVKSPGQF